MSDIEVERKGEVEWIRLNRPDRMNAYDAEMAGELIDAVENASDAGVIVLTGTGRAFCAGGYLANLSDPDPEAPGQERQRCLAGPLLGRVDEDVRAAGEVGQVVQHVPVQADRPGHGQGADGATVQGGKTMQIVVAQAAQALVLDPDQQVLQLLPGILALAPELR